MTDPIISADEIADALTTGDNDFDDERNGWWGFSAVGPILTGTFTGSGGAAA